jgi:hypothetical protein
VDEGLEQAPDDSHSPLDREAALPQERSQGSSGYVLHRDEVHALRAARLVERRDRRMLDLGARPRLAEQSVANRGLETGGKKLQRRRPTERLVVREVDLAHAARPQPFLDSIVRNHAADAVARVDRSAWRAGGGCRLAQSVITRAGEPPGRLGTGSQQGLDSPEKLGVVPAGSTKELATGLGRSLEGVGEDGSLTPTMIAFVRHHASLTRCGRLRRTPRTFERIRREYHAPARPGFLRIGGNPYGPAARSSTGSIAGVGNCPALRPESALMRRTTSESSGELPTSGAKVISSVTGGRCQKKGKP